MAAVSVGTNAAGTETGTEMWILALKKKEDVIAKVSRMDVTALPATG